MNKKKQKSKHYIYTLPQAGTYLMSEFLSLIGSINTGYHISSAKKYLDTFKYPPEINTKTPTKTANNQMYIKTFDQIPFGSHAFGHFCPLYIPPDFIIGNNIKFICVKRNPREILTSEFIDFRYRRTDLKFIHVDKIADPLEAFEHYMEKHANAILKICKNYLLLNDMTKNIHYRELLGSKRHIFVAFQSFINETTGPEMAIKIAKFVNPTLDDNYIVEKWREALIADNKTKSVDLSLPFNRDELWTPKALSRYRQLGFPEIGKQLIKVK